MSPILGIIASQNYSRTPLNGFVSIATSTVGAGGSSTITFSGIPQVYKHLQLRGISKHSATTPGFPNVSIYFNSDTTFTNYRGHYIAGNGSTVSGGGVQASGWGAYSFNTVSSSTNSGYADTFGACVVDILDYTSVNKNKTIRTLSGQDVNGSGEMLFNSGLWLNSSSAVNSLTLNLPGGGNFVQNSKFALYGIEG